MTFDARAYTPRFEWESAPPPPSWDEAHAAIHRMVDGDREIVHKYVNDLRQQLAVARRQADVLDRKQYRPGDGDMGG